MDKPEKKFNYALCVALIFTASLIVGISLISYASYAQYTGSIVLLNLRPCQATYLVQLFYSIGLICSFCLQIVPTIKILQKTEVYKAIPSPSLFPDFKNKLSRILLGALCCLMAYLVPNLGQFINFQGAATGVLIAFVFPILFYCKTYRGKISYLEYAAMAVVFVISTVGGTLSAKVALEAMIGD